MINCYYPKLACDMIADLGNGPCTTNGDRSSSYFALVHDEQCFDVGFFVALLENVHGLEEKEQFY